MSHRNKHVVLGVTGGIAIYKVPELIRSLKKKGITVEVVMTEAAQEFVTPLTFKEVTGLPVHTEIFSSPREWVARHVTLARKADLVAIIPATANIIGKIASGIADDLLSTMVMAAECPVLLAPAMNKAMYENPVVKRNMALLSDLNYRIVPAECGMLLCGEEGKGRLASLDTLEEEILKLLTTQDLAGKRVLITAGPTREYIDPVRFISNGSSGRMGYALAREAYRRGGEVTLVSGPTELPAPYGVRRISVTTTRDLYEAVMENFSGAEILIMSAAPADFRPETTYEHKVKKTTEAFGEIRLLPNPDIAKDVGEKKGGRFLAIFAAETENLIVNAREKLIRKNADLVIANCLTEPGAGFAHPTNKVTILTPEEALELPLMSKEEAATEIITAILRLQRGDRLVGEKR